MKGLKWLLAPAVVLIGLAFFAPQRAESARWSFYVGEPYPAYAGHYVYRYRAPRYYVRPGPVLAPVYPAPVYPAPVIVAPPPYRVYRGPAPFYHVW